MVAEGGVLYLVHGLVHPDLAVSCCCSEMLARLASTHQQQPLQAIRCVVLLHSQSPDPDTLRRVDRLNGFLQAGSCSCKCLCVTVTVQSLKSAMAVCVRPAGLLVVCRLPLSCCPALPPQPSSCSCCPLSQPWHAAARRRVQSWHRQERPLCCCRWWLLSPCHVHRWVPAPLCSLSC